MKISLELTNEEIKLISQAFQMMKLQTTEPEMLIKIDRIIKIFENEIMINDTIFREVKRTLEPYTNQEINLNSHLWNQLSIDQSWYKEYAHRECNTIVKKLIKIYKQGKTFNEITQSDTAKCEIVKDIIKLIKTKYESAE